jgi:hypothetical protein
MLGDLPRECARIMRSYIAHYEHEDQRYVTIDSEMDEVVTLPNGLRVNVIVDLVVWDKRYRGIWLWDHKTRKNFEDADNIILDPQGSRYYDAAQLMGYRPLLGFVQNEIRTKAPAIPSVLRTGGLSKRKNIDTDVRTYMAEIRRHGLDPNRYRDILQIIAARQKDKFFRRTALPKDPPILRTTRRELVQSANEIIHAKQKDAYPRTFDRSCSWGCDYRDICIAELLGGDISSMIKMNYTTSRRARRGDE